MYLRRLSVFSGKFLFNPRVNLHFNRLKTKTLAELKGAPGPTILVRLVVTLSLGPFLTVITTTHNNKHCLAQHRGWMEGESSIR